VSKTECSALTDRAENETGDEQETEHAVCQRVVRGSRTARGTSGCFKHGSQ
jgi:hypothetical protein